MMHLISWHRNINSCGLVECGSQDGRVCVFLQLSLLNINSKLANPPIASDFVGTLYGLGV